MEQAHDSLQPTDPFLLVKKFETQKSRRSDPRIDLKNSTALGAS